MNVPQPKKLKSINPARKLIPRKTHSQLLEGLESAIEDIYNQNASSLSFEELYRSSYNLVLSKKGEVLYETTNSKIIKELEIKTNRSLGKLNYNGHDSLESGQAFIKKIRDLWLLHISSMLMIQDVLMYMDKVYVKSAKKLPVYDLGMLAFRNKILLNPKYDLLPSLIGTIVDLMHKERQGYSVDRESLKTVIGMTIELRSDNTKSAQNIFEEQIKPAILESSTEFYRTEFRRLIKDPEIVSYSKQVQSKRKEEADKSKAYLSQTICKDFDAIITQQLISPLDMSYFNSVRNEIDSFLLESQFEDFAIVYSTLSSVPEKEKNFLEIISNHICAQGNNLINDIAQNPQTPATPKPKHLSTNTIAIQWVDKLILLYSHYHNFSLKTSIKSRDLQYIINQSIATIVNNNPHAAEYVSIYIDDQIKKGFKGKTDDESETILSQVVVLFRFLRDKDLFELYLRQRLHKRLLSGRPISRDIEASLISKLKLECGSQFTTKLEGMLKDIQLSVDLSQQFAAQQDYKPSDTQIDVSVLTHTFWPLSNVSTDFLQESSTDQIPLLPINLQNLSNQFSHFYKQKYSGRKFMWSYNLGTAELKAQFKNSKHELTVSTIQMMILMLFNFTQPEHRIGYMEIKNRTGLPDSELNRNLQSLACTKYKILLKTPKSRDVSTTDMFEFNQNFSAPSLKIKVPLIAAPTQSPDSKTIENQSKIDEERRVLVDAAIVRIMKSRRKLDHSNLVAETISQLKIRFMPSPHLIKLRIDSLIDRDYIERSKQDRKLYTYIA
ncbi:hypothetical protein BB559_001201 [Furculomyces boomerangus]|uniref:Cullin family profile domain-containing protein n=2 Tax=Harpellales TaxID=61421 RepID=A0A2T9Z2S9_9FUNG|nr:hypothetical protein BB559_001201 [Furculomyces boomerangus]PVZ99350.1 hypothetical protein BB558_004638 [Smittium angustum]